MKEFLKSTTNGLNKPIKKISLKDSMGKKGWNNGKVSSVLTKKQYKQKDGSWGDEPVHPSQLSRSELEKKGLIPDSSTKTNKPSKPTSKTEGGLNERGIWVKKGGTATGNIKDLAHGSKARYDEYEARGWKHDETTSGYKPNKSKKDYKSTFEKMASGENKGGLMRDVARRKAKEKIQEINNRLASEKSDENKPVGITRSQQRKDKRTNRRAERRAARTAKNTIGGVSEEQNQANIQAEKDKINRRRQNRNDFLRNFGSQITRGVQAAPREGFDANRSGQNFYNDQKNQVQKDSKSAEAIKKDADVEMNKYQIDGTFGADTDFTNASMRDNLFGNYNQQFGQAGNNPFTAGNNTNKDKDRNSITGNMRDQYLGF